MKISAQFSLWAAIIFAVLCLGYGLNGLWHISELSDETARSDARGFAMFWLFLGAISVVAAIVSWWMVKNDPGDGS